MREKPCHRRVAGLFHIGGYSHTGDTGDTGEGVVLVCGRKRSLSTPSASKNRHYPTRVAENAHWVPSQRAKTATN